eukprot:CAMPEP_0118724876 /NCGR_PEP_ID=MMETSP0800-20121206/32833_1 /TAXON_ID=210618 ORGANISM="Striatella unipunctata, Strain CCMP2910" /NCGR_SAMPLE_ID=MMETSP0800 /ASSEMBLY_ACC=CAM_ASM_000638 /LENGTH=103 /DNA_ID=CAMNT_0006633523 /DNA_START=438 /DNA_END=746 /DNA_ORIENTATION=+
MWSIGCIFGELILKDALLQGQGELDQIDQIFRFLGPPTEANWPDFKKLPNTGLFRWSSNKRRPSIYERFPVMGFASTKQTYLDGNGLDLLLKLLALDPRKRVT